MKRLAAALLTTLVLTPFLAAQRAGTKPLEIYVVDTEGGKATLFVSPTGQTLLIDSGNPGDRVPLTGVDWRIVTAGGGGQGSGRGGAAAHTPAYWIKISAQTDGTFTVTNSRNGFSKTYTKR